MTAKRKSWTELEDAEIRRWWPIIRRHEKGKTALWLAEKLNVSVCQVRGRAAKLGLRRGNKKGKPWSERELDILDKNAMLSLKTIAVKLRRAGFDRTETGIAVMRSRRNIRVSDNIDAYSANGLSQLLGVSNTVVMKWIRKGWLKATPRGESENAFGGPGDRYLIFPHHVREFIIDHAVLIDLNHADTVWLVDLLTNTLADSHAFKMLKAA